MQQEYYDLHEYMSRTKIIKEANICETEIIFSARDDNLENELSFITGNSMKYIEAWYRHMVIRKSFPFEGHYEVSLLLNKKNE